MKRSLVIIICFCVIISFSACRSANRSTFDRIDTLTATDNGSDYLSENIQEKPNITYGTYILSDMYYVSNGTHVDAEQLPTYYIYLENNRLLVYVNIGVQWICRNYNYNIVGDTISCVPVYNNGLVNISFSYDTVENKIIQEANDVILVFRYHSTNKPVEDDDVYKNE